MVEGCRVIARLVALNVSDPALFKFLFDGTPSTVDPPLPRQAPDPTRVSSEARTEPVPNLGTLGSLQKQLVDVLAGSIEDALFPIDPQRVPACIDGELELPLINEPPFCCQTTTFPPRRTVHG